MNSIRMEEKMVNEKPWKEIRKKLHEKPDIWIGKSGISQGVIEETRKILKVKKIVKIKFLKNIASSKADAENLAKELAEKTGAKIGKIIGKTVILYTEKEGL